jgi:hypothetical protein
MMRRALNSLALVCFALLSLGTSRTTRPPVAECPTITVDCATECFEVGDTYTVKANVSGADPGAKLSYTWSVTSGNIISGQDTPTLTAVKAEGGQSTTITVEVGGLDSSCQKTASCSLTICHAPVSRRFDKYGDLVFADEKKRLDYFAEQLKKEPDSQGYIMVYGKRGARAGEAQARAVRAKDYLVTKGGIVAERLATIDGGDHEKFSIELWITPRGGQPPSPVDQYGEAPEG